MHTELVYGFSISILHSLRLHTFIERNMVLNCDRHTFVRYNIRELLFAAECGKRGLNSRSHNSAEASVQYKGRLQQTAFVRVSIKKFNVGLEWNWKQPFYQRSLYLSHTPLPVSAVTFRLKATFSIRPERPFKRWYCHQWST